MAGSRKFSRPQEGIVGCGCRITTWMQQNSRPMAAGSIAVHAMFVFVWACVLEHLPHAQSTERSLILCHIFVSWLLECETATYPGNIAMLANHEHKRVNGLGGSRRAPPGSPLQRSPLQRLRELRDGVFVGGVSQADQAAHQRLLHVENKNQATEVGRMRA